ncbi:MAG: DNA gyrase subunit B [Lachnospiraceae bacterium]|nr:DNA gyrase subunit B [Lachnospiraceae bacterium]
MAKTSTYDASSITVLEGLEAVRVRPGMYIGSVSTKGLNHLIYEIVDNAVDEHLAGYCDTIQVTLEKDGSATVTDNGRGIPVGMHEKGISAERLVFTTLHAGGKFDNSAYKTSGGLHGVGSSVVNALSTRLTVRVKTGGFIYEDKYERGEPVIELEDGLLPVLGRTKETGTIINFLPDDTIFDKTWFKEDDVKSRLHETAYLNPQLTIIYEDRRREETEHIEYHEPDGIRGFIKDMNKTSEAVHEVIYFAGESDGIAVEVAFQYVNEFHENVLGFCNNIYNAEGGTHLTGFKTAFTNVINTYARELNILKEKDVNFTGADVRNGITAVISIKHPDPRFEGQTKTKLDNQDAAKVVSKVTSEEVVHIFDRNLDVLKNIISCAEKAAKIRKAEEKAKTNMLTKQKFSFDSNGKLANCVSREADKCEIFIVEGDSAGGSAKSARNRMYQAILPIRGKILNVEKASIDKVLANAEIKTMINAFGCGFSEGYGNDFDISKLRYDKIIIMADADVDGSHISNLLLTLFYRFMPELIYEGHVYIAMPPLYKAMPSKGEEEYLYDDKALERYRKRHKGPFTLQRYKGLGEMDPQQLWDTTLNPETRLLKKVEIEDGRMASSITELLMGTEVPPRKAFIYDHAEDAQLDI